MRIISLIHSKRHLNTNNLSLWLLKIHIKFYFLDCSSTKKTCITARFRRSNGKVQIYIYFYFFQIWYLAERFGLNVFHNHKMSNTEEILYINYKIINIIKSIKKISQACFALHSSTKELAMIPAYIFFLNFFYEDLIKIYAITMQCNKNTQ